MRDADLWEDVGKMLMRSCGDKVGNMVSAAIEVASGETDLAAARVEGNQSLNRAAMKRNFIVSRMVASEAVASEFIVTGSFLTVTVGAFLMESAGLTMFMQLMPTPPGKLAAGCDPCACDKDGWVGGLNTWQDGGCVANRTVTFGRLAADLAPIAIDTGASLCLV